MTVSQLVGAAKASIALAGALLFLWEIWAHRRPNDRFGPLRQWSLIALGVVALAGWWNFGALHYGRYVHQHEFFHYYLGAKYQQELGYTRLYRCVAIAEAEEGRAAEVARRWVRNLDTNVIERGRETLLDPGICTEQFSEARWEGFRNDVGWFRDQVSDSRWREIQMDHGYNATPVWTMTGTLLANLGPASSRQVHGLALLDPLLLLVLWGVMWRTVGWQAASVAAIWWGTNYPARFYWTGGAFLRTDWLVLMTLSVCFAYRKWMFGSGVALAGAALLRIFPVFIAGGLALQEAARMWRERTLWPSRGFQRFAAGACTTSVLLLSLSSLVNSGRLLDIPSWQEFAANSSKHLANTSVNRMGLRVLAAFDPASTVRKTRDVWIDAPLDAWYSARQQTFARREVGFWAVFFVFTACLVRSVDGRRPWMALVLGVGLLPFGVELTCYYYAFFLLYGFLAQNWPWAGAALCAVSFLTWVPPAILEMQDESYLLTSLIVVLFVTGATVSFALSNDSRTLS